MEITEELVERVIKKEDAAITQIYNMTINKSYYMARLIIKDEDIIQDILQDAYVQAFSKISSLNNLKSIQSWINTIVKNKAIDYLRRNKELTFSDLTTENEDYEVEIEENNIEFIPEQFVDYTEIKKMMWGIIESLPAEQRICIISYFYEQKSMKEIAVELGCGEETVKSRIRYGKKKIKNEVQALEKKGVKLYSISAIPFIYWMFKEEAKAVRYGSNQAVVLENVKNLIGIEAMAKSVTLGGNVIGKVTSLSLAQKVALSVIGIGITGLVVVGVVKVIDYNNQTQEANYELQEEEQTESPEESTYIVEVTTEDETEENTEKPDIHVYDEILAQVSESEKAAFVELNGLELPVLLVSGETYKHTVCTDVAMGCSIYAYIENEVINLGDIYSGGTAYPISADDSYIYAAAGHCCHKYKIDIEKRELVVQEVAAEKFGENATPTYYYGNEETEEQIVPDNSYLERLFDEYKEADIVAFFIPELLGERTVLQGVKVLQEDGEKMTIQTEACEYMYLTEDEVQDLLDQKEVSKYGKTYVYVKESGVGFCIAEKGTTAEMIEQGECIYIDLYDETDIGYYMLDAMSDGPLFQCVESGKTYTVDLKGEAGIIEMGNSEATKRIPIKDYFDGISEEAMYRPEYTLGTAHINENGEIDFFLEMYTP